MSPNPEAILTQALATKAVVDAKLLSDRVFICTNCGAVNTYFKWVCETCADPNGGDHEND